MLIESDPHQTRIAVLEDDRLTEIFVERPHHRGYVGNVYKGRVTRVLPGMQAAFVDIGLERDAFLYVADVQENLEALDEHHGDGDPVDDHPAANGNGHAHGGGQASGAAHAPIESLLHPGQDLVVQVIKDPLPNKGARVSTQITLPGRYLVLLPNMSHRGISRRIEDETERARLRQVLAELPGDPDGSASNYGLIVRTAGEGKGLAEFTADRAYLCELWDRLSRRAERVAPPNLLHRDLDLALRVVRDLFSSDYSMLWVEGEDTYERIVEFLDQVQPALLGRVKLYSQDEPLFSRFGIEREIAAALRSKVWLKSGGYLVINPTEALVAIDVNTGRYVGRTNLEDTVLKTNLEAVEEVVRQIRLRDLGGIIVLDLIDMTVEAHREQVFGALEAALRKDRAKTKVLSISEFGLVEITRKRSRSNLERLLTQPCPYCQGSGRIKNLATLCLDLRRELLLWRGRTHGKELLVRLHPDVARALQQSERAILDELERALEVSLVLKGDPELHHERFDILEV
jgi:ribonuclease G